MGLAIKDAPLDSFPHTYQALLPRIQEVCHQFHIVSLNRQIEACENLLQQDQLIDVAILGQFKSGKSSFLNSLVGKPILPVGVIPVTTTITRLQYGNRERAIVRHFDGQQTEVDIGAIEEFTSEAKNPANQKNVEMVNVELPSLEKYAGLRLVDTPGLGSIFKYHIETSENWLPEVGTALLAISSDRPLRRMTCNSFGIYGGKRQKLFSFSPRSTFSPRSSKKKLSIFSGPYSHGSFTRNSPFSFTLLAKRPNDGNRGWKTKSFDPSLSTEKRSFGTFCNTRSSPSERAA